MAKYADQWPDEVAENDTAFVETIESLLGDLNRQTVHFSTTRVELDLAEREFNNARERREVCRQACAQAFEKLGAITNHVKQTFPFDPDASEYR